MKKIFILFFFFINVQGKDFCLIEDINFIKENQPNCSSGQMTFGYLKFVSDDYNFKYIFNNQFKTNILEKYNSEISLYLNSFCDDNEEVRMKVITNFDKKKKNYNNVMIITCNFKVNPNYD